MESLIHEKFRNGTDYVKVVETPKIGLCPPHNFIKIDQYWKRCTWCGEVRPLLDEVKSNK